MPSSPLFVSEALVVTVTLRLLVVVVEPVVSPARLIGVPAPALGAQEAGFAGVPGPGIQLRHHPTHGSASVGAGGVGKIAGCTMCARISRPSTSRGPGRLK